MRHTKLKDKLDNVKQDFDKEALWQNINKRSKKRWSLLWLFGLFIGVIAVGSYAISKHYFTQDNNHSATNSASHENQLSTENYSSKSENNSNSHITLKPNQENASLNNAQNVVPSGNKIPKTNSMASSMLNEISNNTSQNKVSISSASLTGTLVDESKVAGVSQDENVQIYRDENLTQVQSQFLEASHIEAASEKVMEKDLNPIDLINVLVISDWRDSITLAYVLNQDTKKQISVAKKNSIGLSVGLGLDHHAFSKFRTQFEKSLESRFLSVVYNRKVMGHFTLQTKFSYCHSQTNVSFTRVDTTLSLNVQNKAVKAWSGNKYDLYNQYQRLDAAISIGYDIEMGKSWQLRPSMGWGINIMHNEYGDTWDQEYSRQNIQFLKAYDKPMKSFLLYQIQLSKIMAKDYHLGLGFSFQSKRFLASDALYSHQIRPMSIEVNFGKGF
jgi:hypothetical protein